MNQLSEGGIVRIGPVAVIPSILRTFNADPAEVLGKAGFDLRMFEDPDTLISYAARSHLIKLCVDRTQCHHFGLLIGERNGLSSLGLVGYLVQHSPDVDSALHSLIRYFHLHVQGAILNLALEDGLAFLGYSIHQSRVEAADQIEDGAVAMMFNIMRALCGTDWKPVEVCFAHRRPANTEPFQRFFRVPLRFDAERNGLFFGRRWLQRPVSGADPELHRLLHKQVDKLEAEYKDNFPEQVRRVLHTALLARHSTADQVAALFSIHRRTLNRRLKTFGTSFQELVDQSRYELARRLLEDSEMEVCQIANVLNYTDASTFTRAFRRWSGTTPARWRSGHRVDDLQLGRHTASK